MREIHAQGALPTWVVRLQIALITRFDNLQGTLKCSVNLAVKNSSKKLRSRLDKVISDHENLRSRSQWDREQDLINKSS